MCERVRESKLLWREKLRREGEERESLEREEEIFLDEDDYCPADACTRARYRTKMNHVNRFANHADAVNFSASVGTVSRIPMNDGRMRYASVAACVLSHAFPIIYMSVFVMDDIFFVRVLFYELVVSTEYPCIQ
jgi:hypothetical protein